MVTLVGIEDIDSIQGQVSASLAPYPTVEVRRDFVMGPPDEEDDDLEEEELEDEDVDEDEDEVDDDDLTEDEDEEDEDDEDE